jgi:peptide/nickel transport system substrate-binding protein
MLSKKNLFVVFAMLIIASMVLSACATPTPQTVIETVVVTEVVEKEGETVIETKIVEVEVQVTPTPEPEETEPPPPAVSPEFKNPDTLMIVTGAGEQETLDPAWTYETRGSGVETNIYESMIWPNRTRTDEFIPMLSTGWEVNETGDVWTFQVREGVTFHKGGTLEPHDVAYSVHRALLQDRIDGPHWMTLDAFLGVGGIKDLSMELGGVESFDEVPADALVEACEMVKSAVVADDEAGTVTYYLNAPTPWFLSMLAQPFLGAVLDMEWMVENGDWDGSCDTWVAFNDPPAQDTILFQEANGTGPYMLDYWTPGEETVLVANEDYWRTEPIWEGGPSGVASIKRVVLRDIPEWGTRLAMFEAGDADYIYVNAQYRPVLAEYMGLKCQGDGTCEEVGDGYIRAYTDLTSPNMTPAQFNWTINNEGGNPFVGSGELDGNGIPPDFFADIHVRKAFNYCFDWDTLISDVFNGEAKQPQGPIIYDMMGFREGEAPLYSYDPAMCEEEFKAAFDGAVWENGFYMQIAYNQGNAERQGVAEILKAGVEAVNPAFNVQVISMPWPVILNTRRQNKLPVYIGGWLEDFHDPHNWVHPFLHSQGAYGRVVNIAASNPELAAEFDAMIDEGATLTTVEERRPIYEAIQLKAEEEAVMVFAYQRTERYHYQRWIDGWYFNPALSSPQYAYIYAMSKTAP